MIYFFNISMHGKESINSLFSLNQPLSRLLLIKICMFNHYQNMELWK